MVGSRVPASHSASFGNRSAKSSTRRPERLRAHRSICGATLTRLATVSPPPLNSVICTRGFYHFLVPGLSHSTTGYREPGLLARPGDALAGCRWQASRSRRRLPALRVLLGSGRAVSDVDASGL